MNWYAVGFVGIMGVTLVGVDVFNQSRSGTAEDGFGLASYASSITGRFETARSDRAAEKAADSAAEALLARQSAPAKTHLPVPPQGWQRRELTEADRSRLYPPAREMAGFEKELIEDMQDDPVMSVLMTADKAAGEKRDQRNIWVYDNGTDLVMISAAWTPTPKKQNGIAGLQQSALAMASHNIQGMSSKRGYAWVDGVMIFETSSIFSENPAYRTFEGKLGSQITLSLRADASDAAIRQLIGLIDYDGLNAMLDTPDPAVGSHNPDLPVEEQILLGDIAAEKDRDAYFAKSEELEQEFMNRTDAFETVLTGMGLIPEEKAELQTALPRYEDIAPAPVEEIKTTALTSFFNRPDEGETEEVEQKPALPRRLVMNGSNGCGAGQFCRVGQ